jgi:tubulin-specific chaperone D
MPHLIKALTYDVPKGNISVGQNVRDAACYVTWTFARAYSPSIMKNYVGTIAKYLMVVSLFDRETNCRRAASAAFQENVGRQGNFPHGIEILTEADYFTLGNRVNSYLNVSCFIAQFEAYYETMIRHLWTIKLRHWEPQIRKLTSQALSVLSVFNPEHMINNVRLFLF